MKNCIICGKETTGSTGAAGLKWSKICQDCKNKEDSEYLNMIKRHADIFKNLCETMGVGK